MQNKRILAGMASLLFLVSLFLLVHYTQKKPVESPPLAQIPVLLNPQHLAQSYDGQTATVSATPKPLTFAEMNEQFGPCVSLPTLMYHHIEDMNKAKSEGHANLSVAPDVFRNQLTYLRSKGYIATFPNTVIDFFDKGVKPNTKSVLLTFDDGYDDFYTNVYPLLKEFGMKAVLFLPTGLANNPGYVTWNQVSEMNASGLVFIANHTWSHKSMDSGAKPAMEEMKKADQQLFDHAMNNPKVFAFPYGTTSSYAISDLSALGYQAGFTTKHGKVLCKKQRLILPRIRVGNAPLASFGL